MNKRFFTLAAAFGLAASAITVNAQGKVTTLPTAAAATVADKSMVYLNGVTNGIDLNGLTADYKKDSLIWDTALTDGRSKAHIDSLIFTVGYSQAAKMYAAVPTAEHTFTFTSKIGKFAFNKPAAGKKVANAFVKTNGALGEWILPVAYTTTAATGTEGYVPFVVATRVSATDQTPKTVYVLAQVTAAGAALDIVGAKTSTVQVIEVPYAATLAASFADDDARSLVMAIDGGVTWGSASATHIALSLVGPSAITDAARVINVIGENAGNNTTNTAKGIIADATGFQTPSFSFENAKLNVSKGEDNLLASYNFQYEAKTADTKGGYLKAIGAKSPKGQDLYLTVDTIFYDAQNSRNYALALDTMPSALPASKTVRQKETFEFTIDAAAGSDALVITTVNAPTFIAAPNTTGKDGSDWVVAIGGKIAHTAVAQPIVVKQFGVGSTAKNLLTVKDATSDTGIETPLIVASEFPTRELEDQTVAQFTTGDVYMIYDFNKTKADKKTANPYFGQALIIDNMNSTTTQLFSDKYASTLPSHQWVAVKKNNVYTFQNRETTAAANCTVATVGTTKLADERIYSLGDNLYTYGDMTDTLFMEKVATVSPFDGYDVISKEAQMNNSFNLRFVGDLLGQEAFVQISNDSIMGVAIDNADNAAELRILNWTLADNDTVKYGRDNEMKRVAYAIKAGRHFLVYDAVKKAYRFTKEHNYRPGAESADVADKFFITQLAKGGIALVPQTDYPTNKLAIDSETGNAVRVALNSDLRHTFELTEPVNRVFANILYPAKNSDDTTLVNINLKSVENANWMLAQGEDSFLYEGIPSTGLKAGGMAYDSTAFSFTVDTAYVQRTGNTMPMYYLTMGAKRHAAIPVDHVHDNGADHVCPEPMVNDTVSGKYLFIMQDSLTTKANKEKYAYTYSGSEYAKLQFVDAKRVVDTLIVDAGRVKPLAMDTLKAGKIAEDAKVEQYLGQWTNYKNKALFAFRVNMDNKDEYAIYNPATGAYLTYLNGFVVATAEASFYTIAIGGEKGDTVVSNDDIKASSVEVIATNGAVIIKGAQGKKVAISNILGQTIANTVLSSDDATIAAPAGVVVVAVEGEAAVKAIVK